MPVSGFQTNDNIIIIAIGQGSVQSSVLDSFHFDTDPDSVADPTLSRKKYSDYPTMIIYFIL